MKKYGIILSLIFVMSLTACNTTSTSNTTAGVTQSTQVVNAPGPEVVELVNAKGEEATGYKLADGTYMDRVQMVYTYDGLGTWTDSNGVKWNEK